MCSPCAGRERQLRGGLPCPRPQALPFGLIRHRCRMEGPEYLLCRWPAPHSPWNIPCAFLSPNLCADRSPHTESPPTRLYPSRSFPSVGLRRPTPSPSLPAQPRTAYAALHASTLSSDPLFSPDTALRGCGPSLADYLGFHHGALRQAWPAPSQPRPPVNVRCTLVSRNARSVSEALSTQQGVFCSVEAHRCTKTRTRAGSGAGVPGAGPPPAWCPNDGGNDDQ